VHAFAAGARPQDNDGGFAVFVLARDGAADLEVGQAIEDRVPEATASRILGASWRIKDDSSLRSDDPAMTRL
jgi:hypothetical protein